MINGFEGITSKLTSEEKKAVYYVKQILSKRVGSAYAISSYMIILEVKQHGILLSSPRIRKIINYIRIKQLLPNLAANSRGYYIENDQKRLQTYIESLNQRADAIKAVANSYI